MGLAHQLTTSTLIEKFNGENTFDDFKAADTIHALLSKATERNIKQDRAIVFLPTGEINEDPFVFSQRQVMDTITQFANYLNSIGVGCGDAVSIALPNLPETVFALWGAESQAIANPINPMLQADHLCGIIQAAEAKVLVTLAPNPVADVWATIKDHIADIPTLEKVVMVNMMKYYVPAGSPVPPLPASIEMEGRTIEILDFDVAIAGQNSVDLDCSRPVETTDICAYFHTGGTTGMPKLAQHSHHNQIYSAWSFTVMSDFDEGVETFLGGLPLFHIYAAFGHSLLGLVQGQSYVMATPSGYRAPAVIPNIWKLVDKYKISFISTVPTIVSAMVDLPVGDADISSMKIMMTGAAPIASDTLVRFADILPIPIVEGYGMTELTGLATITPLYGEVKVGSIGLPVPFMELKVAKLDDQHNITHECSADEVGLLLVRGDGIFQGYKQSERNEGVILDDGWVNTDDLMYRDKDGYYFAVGRAKDTIIRGGHNIDPVVIDSAMDDHPDVVLCAAVGMPDKRVGEIPVSYVTVKQGADITTGALLSFVKDKIHEKAAVPKQVTILQEMPVTAVGKIFKPALRRMAAATMVQELLNDAAITAIVSGEAHTKYEKFVRIIVSDTQDVATATDLTVDIPQVKTEVVMALNFD